MSSDSTASAVMRAVLQTEGVRGFFHGMTTTWIRDMPGYFFFFWGNEFTKSLLTPAGKTKDDLGEIVTSSHTLVRLIALIALGCI